ncbi:hypothetical protein EKD16_10620 [Streptomonospora litoralis]|uniref:Uncharacterized protein n=1 Tax=Streptomonospora litoralis TaxID=2498135 RepID=A0A4P6Q1E5_9ACTN|nr:hypothetical protein EKD16_10620 [Streptomonospora litoralis]
MTWRKSGGEGGGWLGPRSSGRVPAGGGCGGAATATMGPGPRSSVRCSPVARPAGAARAPRRRARGGRRWWSPAPAAGGRAVAAAARLSARACGALGGGHAARLRATRCTYVRRHRHRRRPEVPPPHRDSAIRNNAGCFVHQCPISQWVRGRAAAATAHEARRMARKQPRSQLFVRLVATASAEAARKTGIDPKSPPHRGVRLSEATPRRNERRGVAPDPRSRAPPGRASARDRAPPRGLRPVPARQGTRRDPAGAPAPVGPLCRSIRR